MQESKKKGFVILLAEDNPADQELTRLALDEGEMGSELRVVGDGEEALDYLYHRGKYRDASKSPRPHLMLLDLNMPKVDGKQVLERMRADSSLRRIPVVALTTSSEDDDIQRTYELGANSYITKPTDLDQFSDVIRALEHYWFQVVALPPTGD